MRLKLEDHCDLINGGSWTANEYSTTGYPVLKVSNFDKDSISFDELSYLHNESFHKYRRNRLKLFDIVIATVGSHPSLVNSAAGRVITIPKTAVGLLLNQNAVCLRTKAPNLIEQRYLGYLCKSQVFQHFIQQRGKGAANQMRIPIGGIKNFEFDFPIIETQRKIAAILSAYDDLIENNLKRIQLLEEKAQLTYEEWFVRMKFPGHERTPINKETGLPAGWEKKTIDEACNISGGGTPSRTKDEYWNEGHISWFSPTDLTKANSIAVLDSSQKITELGLRKSSAKLLEPNSFMMTSRATIGLFAIIDKPFTTNQGFINVTPHELIHKEFLLYNFITRIEEFKGYATGATFPELSKGKFKVLSIDWPAKELLISFNNLVSKVHATLFSITKQNQLLKEARDLLLPRLMTGMIDVDALDLSAFEQEDQEGMLMAAEAEVNYFSKNRKL
ncbi:restriction endonuclease subunit S [Cyclobacterium sp. SYSU L10401]|uniref:restriction endonuclease subunit S n=1 Tax=Cyclobacterium sp. SYSU L10401 TaxID=2678657 RepID=UPI0013CFE118|nr:restriction endonuclease subunit S [Cyclobacterium sp. SYSU L10401]